MHNSTIIKNALIVTADREQGVIQSGSILIKDGIIEKIQKNDSATSTTNEATAFADFEADKIIDGKNLIIMPGLVNTHGHAAMTLLRGYADDLPLMQWLEDKIWPVEARLTKNDVYWGSLLAIVEMLKSGTTTFTDMYFCMEEVAKAVEKSGIRAVLSRGLIGMGPQSDQALRETRELAKNWHGAAAGRISVLLGPHAPYTCPPDFMKSVMALADKTNLPLQIHIAETKFEVETCRKKYGKSPVKLLNDIGLFNYKVAAAHCVHLDDEDIGILAKKGIGVAHNPGSNLKLGSGIAPMDKMLEAGIKVGLGTDGAASNNNLDMFEELRLAAVLHKGKKENPSLIPAETALEMATCTGAQVVFLENVGKIKEGYKADLIGLSKNLPHFCPLHDVTAHLVYAASGRDVELAMADGVLLMENRHLKTVDEEKILYEAGKCAARLTR